MHISFFAFATGLKRVCLALALALPLMAGPQGALAATPPEREEIRNIVRALIKEQPEIILDVLKNNSEVVLEVAQQGNQQRKRRVLLDQWAVDAKEPKAIKLANEPVMGMAGAPVTIVAFTDFTCSYCRQADGVLDMVLSENKDTVNIVFKLLPKEDVPQSVAAARYALAALLQDEAKGWAFVRLLFAADDLSGSKGDVLFKEAAAQAGLDFKKMQREATGKQVAEMLKNNEAEAERLNITGTPHFFVNDLVIRGAMPLETYNEAIGVALKAKNEK